MSSLGGSSSSTPASPSLPSAGSSLLAACGGDDDGGGGGGGGGPQGSGGILIHGATGGSSKDTLDPHAPVTNPDIARVSNLYEPLLFWDNNYKLEPALAESVEPSKDAKTWTIKLRQGVTFHNGKDVTAEDAASASTGSPTRRRRCPGAASCPQIIDFEATKMVDATTVAARPQDALRDPRLAAGGVHLRHHPDRLRPENPVGTGAFTYKSFDPGKTSIFTKYADYWGDTAFVDELQIQDFTDDSAKVNALQAGQIQTVDNLPYNLIDTIKGAGGGALVSETGAWVPFTMRVDVRRRSPTSGCARRCA